MKKFSAFVQVLSKLIIDFFRKAAVKAALLKLLGSAVMGGFRAWLIKLIVTQMYDSLAVPIFQWGVRKGMLQVDKVTGRIHVKQLRNADTDAEWDDVVDKL